MRSYLLWKDYKSIICLLLSLSLVITKLRENKAMVYQGGWFEHRVSNYKEKKNNFSKEVKL